MQKQTSPYGTWPSPVTTELLTGKTIGLGGMSADGGDLLWLETRPTEGGRTVLVRRTADGTIADLTPPPFDVATRVHEYGGGAYVAEGGRVLFSNKADGFVFLIEGGAPPRPVVAVPGCRYADFRFIAAGAVCVREDHRGRPPNDPATSIVQVGFAAPADRNEGAVLVQGPDFLSSPRPSPDGASLAWLEWDHPDMPWDATRLKLASLSQHGLGPARLVAGEKRESLVQPAWSPGGVLHVCSDRSGWWNLYRVGAGLEPVCAVEAEIGGPQWSFGSRYYAFQPDGGIIAAIIRDGRAEAFAVADGALLPLGLGQIGGCPLPFAGGLAWMSASATEPPAIRLGAETIRASGPAVLTPADISVGESIRFATDDGQIGQAFFYPPVNAGFAAPEGETPPLIVLIHGGPTGMTSDGFSLRIQWWTSRGFAVVDVNYGGSSGFGRAYRERLNGEWGVVDVADCIAAVRHLVDAGRVDPRRVAIRGGSAGGFTTLAAITQSTLFGAAASHYGVADLMLLAGDTHKFESRYLDRLIGPLPQDEAVYRERSPITHLDRVACPVIFFQGLDDKVVPPNQARGMAEAMAGRGLKVALYEFEGEAHGFRRAETIRRTLDLELDFYGKVFGFEPPGVSERVVFLVPG